MSETAIRIVLLGYDGFQTLDLSGPLDVFDAANSLQPGAYETLTASLDGAPFASEAGLRIAPDCALADAGAIDTLILPGGAGLRRPGAAAPIAAALVALAPRVRRMVSVCTGIYGLAATGLLDGKRATTHWRFARDVAARFPAIRLDPDAIFVKDGALYSSAGITAAIDLALALVEEDCGPELALAAARDLVVYLKRPGGQRQYSEPLRFQARATNRFADLSHWIAANLDSDLSVETLAGRARLGPRQFSRRFKDVFGQTPGQQIEALRLDRARELLVGSGAGVTAIAGTVGFRSDDVFRRTFHRHFGLSPTEYRRRFASSLSTPPGDFDAPAPPAETICPLLAADRRRRPG
jgi:transcriptional regulator GlxA family with amidase domain